MHTTGNSTIDITATHEWAALTDHHRTLAGPHLRDLFAEDPDRGRRLARARR